MWAVCPFNINGKGHIYLYRWMYNTQKSTIIQCRGGREPRFFTWVQSSAPRASSSALPSPNAAVLSIMWGHQKPLVLLQGTYNADDNPSKWEGKGLEKGPPISSPHSTLSVTICLHPMPYLAGGVCSQCFAEGQNSQSPDCRSCYSPGGQSEFLLPMEDVEKRERNVLFD